MAESIRELVVTLSLEAGTFSKTCSDINSQIKGVQAEFNAITAGVDGWQSTIEGRKAKLDALTETFTLQQQKISTIAAELEKAKTALAADPDNLGAARKVSSLETQLNNAKAAAANTKAEIEKINLIKFTEFSNKMTTLGDSLKSFGRKFSMYVGAPLVAIGVKSYNMASDYESAMARLQVATGASDEAVAELQTTIVGMSEEIPVSFTEIADLMTTLAQADVPIENLKEVAEIMLALGATSDVGAAESAQSIMQFLTVLNEPHDNIDELASTLLDLGNKSVSTGDQIFQMAQRMASVGNQAGLDAPEILALAAAFSSVGINAEAGGSAASKLMKEFQLIAETGAGTYTDLETMSSLMKVSTDDFVAMWESDPAGTMLDFFDALAAGGASGNESVLALLDSMDLTEVRLSNLIAAAASNPDFFSSMLDTADEAWKENAALAEATAIAYGTAEADMQISLNKMDNASADAGENIIDAVQPIIDKIGDLAKKFGELDEDTQDRWVKIAGALILFGPAAIGIGSAAKGIGDIAGHLAKLDADGVSNWSKLVGFFGSPAFWGVAAGGALLLAVDYLENIPTSLEKIATAAKDIPINLDKAKVEEMQRIIDETQGKMDKLRGGETTAEGEGNTSAVTMGYGTDSMFAQALGYESSKLNAEKNAIILDYAAKIKEVEDYIKANPLDVGNAERLETIKTLKSDMDAEVTDANTKYTETVSALFNGMASAMGDGAEELTRAAELYDLYALVYEATMPTDGGAAIEAELAEKFAEINKKAIALGFAPMTGESIGADLLWIEPIIAEEMNKVATLVGEKDYGMTLLQAILNDTEAVAGLDVSAIEGALDGALSTVDWKAAATKADGEGDFGAYLTQGLADGVTNNTETVKASMYTLKDDTVAALLAAFQMQSPSRLMIEPGTNISAGIAVGIMNGIPLAINAMNALGAAITAIAAAQGAAAGAAYGGAFGKTASASFSVALDKIRRELAALEKRIAAGYGSTPNYNVGGR